VSSCFDNEVPDSATSAVPRVQSLEPKAYPLSSNFLNKSDPFVPPNPNEFDRA
jgi:hypothetical protein